MSSTELASISESILERLGVEVTPTSLTLTDPTITYEDYEELCRFVGRVEKASIWWSCDLLLAGEKLLGEERYQAAEALGISPSRLSNRLSVGRRVRYRIAELSFTHHETVASLESSDQRFWLRSAHEGGWSKDELRRKIQEDQKGEILPPVEPALCECCGRPLAA